MGWRKTVVVSAVVGFSVSAIYTIWFADIEYFRDYRMLNMMLDSRIILWPTSILFLALDGVENWSIVFWTWTLMCVALNVLTYVLAGVGMRSAAGLAHVLLGWINGR